MNRECSTNGERRNAYRILVGKPSKTKTMWENNINMVLRKIEWGDKDWTYLAQDMDHWRALVNTVINIRVS
jgi:hypothetical protein